MNCREVIEFLDDYVSNQAPPRQRAEFERHLSGCRHCSAYLDSYRKTMALSKAAYDDPDAAVGQMPRELVEAVRAARRQRG